VQNIVDKTFVTVFGLLRGPTSCSLQEQALPSKDLPTGKWMVICLALRTVNNLISDRTNLAAWQAKTLQLLNKMSSSPTHSIAYSIARIIRLRSISYHSASLPKIGSAGWLVHCPIASAPDQY
jgi:hypothetical protein